MIVRFWTIKQSASWILRILKCECKQKEMAVALTFLSSYSEYIKEFLKDIVGKCQGYKGGGDKSIVDKWWGMDIA